MTPLRPGNDLPSRNYRPRRIGKIGRGFLITVFTLAGLGWGAMLTALIVGAVAR